MARGVRVTPGARGWWWLAAALALGSLALAAAGTAANTQWDWQPQRVWTQPWRAWTAAWVHYSAMHLTANLSGLALLALLGGVAGCEARDAWAWFGAWPLTQLGLLAEPALAHYGGLSGVLHAGVAVAACRLVLRERGRGRLVGLALWAGLALKVLLEQPWGEPLRDWPGWDIRIAPLAHASGALAGLACAAVAGMRSGRPR